MDWVGFVDFMWIELGLFILCGLGGFSCVYVDYVRFVDFMWIGMGFVNFMWIGLGLLIYVDWDWFCWFNAGWVMWC